MTNSDSVADINEIERIIADYVVSQNPSMYTASTLPRDESLMELGILDSAGIIELVVFIEDKWHIQLADTDFTKERMGSVMRIAALTYDYVSAMPQSS